MFSLILDRENSLFFCFFLMNPSLMVKFNVFFFMVGGGSDQSMKNFTLKKNLNLRLLFRYSVQTWTVTTELELCSLPQLKHNI